ncbi:MAG: hypothetical protein D6762_01020 [Candidatus Neomarinimicrobiota bacterium]|nr:MAG: hypothetical protein D6762_01020 [Candidatus Neomarinimicrobiota bacterium]
MDLKKLRVEKFQRFSVQNFPAEKMPDLPTVESEIEVIFYYIDSIADVRRCVDYCQSVSLRPDNRVILVYAKGRKDGLNRDAIITPFRQGTIPGFVLKAPMLCSLSPQWSAFVLQKQIH